MTDNKESQFNSELSPEEKVIIMRNTFIQNKNESNTIKNISGYLSDSFSKIDGFQYQWNSLITSNPLLFEDTDYVRCKQYVRNTITDEEIEAYKKGEVRELYATFENLLVCNLTYYDRIMSFCTMIFLQYVRLSDEEITREYLDNITMAIDLTPTQIWCCALSNSSSTEWELKYAWNIAEKLNNIEGKSCLETNWQKIYRNQTFAKFIEYASLRCGSNGFRETLLSDKTSNRKLSQVCTKFTRTSTAISEEQLNTISDYIREQELINKKLYNSIYDCLLKLFNNDETQFAIYIFSQEFYIHTSKFSMKVAKNLNGKITKDYLANSYECFAAEEYLYDSIKIQIEWAKYQLPIQYEYDKQILSSLLSDMLKENFKNILCIRRMNDFGVLARITFSGVFNNIYINEDLMFDNRSIRSSKLCMSKINAAQYIVDRGYSIFGLEKDVYEFEELNKKNIITHYSNYCIPVMQHMSSIIQLHNLNKNDIIDVVCTGTLNTNKLNNKNIKYTDVKTDINARKLMSMMFAKQSKQFEQGKKSYWKVIEED